MAQMLPRKKYCPTAILAEVQLYLKHIGQKCGPSAMLAKGKDRDEGCDHAKKTKCELNVLHLLLGIILSISNSARLRLRVHNYTSLSTPCHALHHVFVAHSA